MNAKSTPQTPAIKDWLKAANKQLDLAGITSANLDAEIILSSAVGQNRTYLHAHPEKIIDNAQFDIANSKLKLRLKRIPIAYIIGHKEFYGRDFLVNSDTLIPRPESEDIIEILKTILTPYSNSHIPIAKLVDVGTGSGCLGISAKLELPQLDVTLMDISLDALKVASQNAQILFADVKIIQSNLLESYSKKPYIVIANLPYVDQKWDRSPETDHEPSLALFADDDGLSIIKDLIIQASVKLANNGHLLLEADPIQHNSIIAFAIKYQFKLKIQKNYILAFTKK